MSGDTGKAEPAGVMDRRLAVAGDRSRLSVQFRVGFVTEFNAIAKHIPMQVAGQPFLIAVGDDTAEK